MSAQTLLGEATTQILVVSDVVLGVPAIKIDEIVASVRELNCTIIPGKIIFQGVLHKQIFFVDTENFVRHQAEDVRFSGFLEFPGIVPENATCQAGAAIEFVGFELLSPTVLHQKVVLAVTVQAFDPPSGIALMPMAQAARPDVFFGSGAGVYRTSGRRGAQGRRYTVRLGTA